MALLHALTVAAFLIGSVLSECGKPATQPDVTPAQYPNLIMNGRQAVPHSWPWQVELQTKGGSWDGGCSGSIITPYHIITAASCFTRVKDPRSWIILVGGHNVSISSGDYEIATVAAIGFHEKFDGRGEVQADLAILTTVKPLEFGPKVSDVCLAYTDINVGARCFVTGWGVAWNGNPKHPYKVSEVLRQTEEFIVPFAMCHNVNISDKTIICAYNKRKEAGACVGDVGGPLLCQNARGVWELQGINIIIKAHGCGKNPDVFTRVSRSVKWIEKIIRMSK